MKREQKNSTSIRTGHAIWPKPQMIFHTSKVYHFVAKKSKKTQKNAGFPSGIRILKLEGDIRLYVKMIYDLGWIKEIHKYYPGNYGAPGVKRNPKRKRTPEEIEKQNTRNREKKIQRLIIANFKEGDWHLILKYKQGLKPKGCLEAKKQLRKFLDNMRNVYKKAGYQFKYIYVTERGERGKWHHHLIIEDIAEPNLYTKKQVIRYWRYGPWEFIPLYEDGEFENLAEYIVKKETKEENDGCSYSRSRNLIIPEPQKEEIHRRRWSKTPKAEKGWYIVKNSVVNGTNQATGYPYQYYMMQKIDKNRDEIRLHRRI